MIWAVLIALWLAPALISLPFLVWAVAKGRHPKQIGRPQA